MPSGGSAPSHVLARRRTLRLASRSTPETFGARTERRYLAEECPLASLPRSCSPDPGRASIARWAATWVSRRTGPRRLHPFPCTLRSASGGGRAKGVLGLDHVVLDRA